MFPRNIIFIPLSTTSRSAKWLVSNEVTSVQNRVMVNRALWGKKKTSFSINVALREMYISFKSLLIFLLRRVLSLLLLLCLWNDDGILNLKGCAGRREQVSVKRRPWEWCCQLQFETVPKLFVLLSTDHYSYGCYTWYKSIFIISWDRHNITDEQFQQVWHSDRSTSKIYFHVPAKTQKI